MSINLLFLPAAMTLFSVTHTQVMNGKKSPLMVAILHSFAAFTTLMLELWPTQASLFPDAEKLTPCTQPPISKKVYLQTIIYRCLFNTFNELPLKLRNNRSDSMSFCSDKKKAMQTVHTSYKLWWKSWLLNIDMKFNFGFLIKERGKQLTQKVQSPMPLENSCKQLPKLDFFPQIVSVLVFPSTSLIKAENTL